MGSGGVGSNGGFNSMNNNGRPSYRPPGLLNNYMRQGGMNNAIGFQNPMSYYRPNGIAPGFGIPNGQPQTNGQVPPAPWVSPPPPPQNQGSGYTPLGGWLGGAGVMGQVQGNLANNNYAQYVPNPNFSISAIQGGGAPFSSTMANGVSGSGLAQANQGGLFSNPWYAANPNAGQITNTPGVMY